MSTLTNAKHEAVAQAFIADRERIGWRAYGAIYPKSSRHTAESAFSALMKKPEFSGRIAELAEQAAQDAVMTAHEVLVELTKIARANMADFVRAFACGDPVAAVDQLTPAQTAALAEVTVEQFMDGRGEDAREVRRVRFRLASKIDALELLGKHHKLYVGRHQHDWGTGLAERLAAALARVGWDRDRQVADQVRPALAPPRGGASGRPQHPRKAAGKDRRAPRL